MEQTAKARLEVHWQGRKPEDIDLQYNPTEINLDKSVQIAEITIPGLDSPLQQFVRGQSEKLTLDLFFDTTEDGMGTQATSVTTRTDRIYALTKIEPKRHAPPICTFHWNSNFPGDHLLDASRNQLRNAFKCIVESVKQKFTLFSPEGVPLRATLTVTFREYKTLDEQLHQLGLSSPDRTHSHILQSGETLSGVAGQYYLRPGDWRQIAKENSIEDPRRLTAGTLLTIPPIT